MTVQKDLAGARSELSEGPSPKVSKLVVHPLEGPANKINDLPVANVWDLQYRGKSYFT